MAILLLLAEMMRSVWMVSDALAKTRGSMGSWLGRALGCNRDGCLAAMEHEAGIEWISGHRLGSGCGCGSGCGLGPGY